MYLNYSEFWINAPDHINQSFHDNLKLWNLSNPKAIYIVFLRKSVEVITYTDLAWTDSACEPPEPSAPHWLDPLAPPFLPLPLLAWPSFVWARAVAVSLRRRFFRPPRFLPRTGPLSLWGRSPPSLCVSCPWGPPPPEPVGVAPPHWCCWPAVCGPMTSVPTNTHACLTYTHSSCTSVLNNTK